jgi:hypothetical protein
MVARRRWNWRTMALGTTLAGALVLGGCAVSKEPVAVDVRPGLACVDDSATCIARRKAALGALLADEKRTWVREPATAAAHASGVRIFAFRTLKRKLTCEELGVGEREAGAAPAALRGGGGRDLTPAQVSRGVMLAGEVGRELGKESRRRCPATPRRRG